MNGLENDKRNGKYGGVKMSDNGSKRGWISLSMACCIMWFLGSANLYAAGTLSSVDGVDPMQIRNHHVSVLLNNGFAKVEVTQTFYNQYDKKMEGVYAFPLPKSASMSEVKIMIGERVIEGEVLGKQNAQKVYEEEKAKGNDAGLGEKNGFQDFRFKIANIPAKNEATITFVYYQPLDIDTGMGRFHYPLEDGGTASENVERFWTQNSKVEGKLSIDVTVKSSWPLSSTRSPGFTPLKSEVDKKTGTRRISYEQTAASLDKDFVFYYRLVDNLPGRVEVIPYRASADQSGSFMMVVTPGADLKKLDEGTDYLFILDKSGSMSGKIRTLNDAVRKSLGRMKAQDRFRIYTFNESSNEVTDGWVNATAGNVSKWQQEVAKIRSGGSTNLYQGLLEPLRALDSDRVTSVVLVTDAVANTGEIDPRAFVKVMKKYDIRLFGFLIGNSGNWPMMRAICNASGGFYDSISNTDDMIGKVLQAGGKVAYESMHDVDISIDGDVYDLTNCTYKKVYRGQQLVIFGRYKKGGETTFKLKARISGEEKVYEVDFKLPAIDTDNPELERLWAMARIEQMEDQNNCGQLGDEDLKKMVRELGIKYQLVTDETSMVVLDDLSFASRDIARSNRARSEIERVAQVQKASKSVVNYSVSSQSSKSGETDTKRNNKKKGFGFKVPSVGGGAIDPLSVLLLALMGALAVWLGHRRDVKSSK